MSLLLPDEQFLQAAKTIVTPAQKTVFISTFKLEICAKKRGEKLSEFFALLISKARTGTDVRILTNEKSDDRHVPDSNAYAIRELKNQGVQIRCLPNSRTCHAKILIVDNHKAIIGSHNLSVKSCHNNFELSYFLTDITTIAYLTELYEKIWSEAKRL